MPSQDAIDIDHTALLSSAALQALDLQTQPFKSLGQDDSSDRQEAAGTTAADELYSDSTTSEQLADIKQALITGDDLLLILGEQGAGKTSLLTQLEANSGLRIQCFPVKGSERFSTINLFTGMLEAFKVTPPDRLQEILDKLIPCLQDMVSKNTLSTVIIDDAHRVNPTELTQLLSGMQYINTQDETLMRVTLAATPGFENRIPELLPEGADLPYSSLVIDSFTPQRAAAYLGYRLQKAGFEGEFPFNERDMVSLVEHSRGLPGGLHALTAEVLNEQHGRIEDSLPPELYGDAAGGFLESSRGKLLLGGLATALIVGGLLMFLPGQDDETRTLADAGGSAVETEELRLIEGDRRNDPVTANQASGSRPSTAPAQTDTAAVNSGQAAQVASTTTQSTSQSGATSSAANVRPATDTAGNAAADNSAADNPVPDNPAAVDPAALAQADSNTAADAATQANRNTGTNAAAIANTASAGDQNTSADRVALNNNTAAPVQQNSVGESGSQGPSQTTSATQTASEINAAAGSARTGGNVNSPSSPVSPTTSSRAESDELSSSISEPVARVNPSPERSGDSVNSNTREQTEAASNATGTATGTTTSSSSASAIPAVSGESEASAGNGAPEVTIVTAATQSDGTSSLNPAPANAGNTRISPNLNAEPVSAEDAELASRLESSNWILLQDPTLYTIQMSASRERESVVNFLRRNPLPAPNSVFSYERDGIVWHALSHGLFSSIEEARQVVERMPEAALRDQPWIRSIRRIQESLRTQ